LEEEEEIRVKLRTGVRGRGTMARAAVKDRKALMGMKSRGSVGGGAGDGVEMERGSTRWFKWMREEPGGEIASNACWEDAV
jgi:hypothetical protein